MINDQCQANVAKTVQVNGVYGQYTSDDPPIFLEYLRCCRCGMLKNDPGDVPANDLCWCWPADYAQHYSPHGKYVFLQYATRLHLTWYEL